MFFEDVAKSLIESLITFQINNPMVLCITETLKNIICNLRSCFLGEDVTEKSNITYKLLKFDITDRDKSRFFYKTQN